MPAGEWRLRRAALRTSAACCAQCVDRTGGSSNQWDRCSRSAESSLCSAGTYGFSPPCPGPGLRCSCSRAALRSRSGRARLSFFPPELGVAAHAGAGRDRERSRLQIAVEDTRGEKLDARCGIDVPLQLATDRHRARPDAAGNLRALLDREVPSTFTSPLNCPATRT